METFEHHNGSTEKPTVSEWFILATNVRRVGKHLTFVDGVKVDMHENEIVNKHSQLYSVVLSTERLVTPLTIPRFRRGEVISVTDAVFTRGGYEIQCISFQKVKTVERTKVPFAPVRRGSNTPKELGIEVVFPEFMQKRSTPMCRIFRRGNQCENVNCSFRHHFVDEKEEQTIQKQRQTGAYLRAKELDPHDHQDQKHPKAQRARVFVEWLLEKYGRDFLNQGTGVVDVAGGSGSVTLHLLCQGVRSTVIDPRTPKLNRHARQVLQKSEIHLRTLPTVQALFGTHSLEDMEQGPLLKGASVLVGLHPDEATEYIVDIAILLEKPFAVVPCCVFPNLFSHRKLLCGMPVVTTAELCEFLSEKNGKISEDYLKINGRNRVVFIDK